MGIDIGTTFTAAAISENGRAATITLGDHRPSIPSVLLLNSDDTFLVGDAAVRRGVSEPERVAREFKRRIGDSQQILVGGVPYSAEMLTSRLLRWVVDQVRQRQGAEPDSIVLAHPANWGSFKTDLLGQAAQMAGLANRVSLATEPEAAAISYAADQRLETGQLVAVYDLGGGTFDSALLRKTELGFAIIGDPIGIERLGGIDFDAAVFAHVSRALDGRIERFDPDDDDVVVSVARLRAECTLARESLSVDTSVTIPVLLPGLSERVRLTRNELESMLRPIVAETVAATRQGMEAAGVDPSELEGVLLVGGCSRTPFVAQALVSEFGRPILLGSEPTYAVALGAAHRAEMAGSIAIAPTMTPPMAVTPPIADSPPQPSSIARSPGEPQSPHTPGIAPLPGPAPIPAAAVHANPSDPAADAWPPVDPDGGPQPNQQPNQASGRLSASRLALVAVGCVGILVIAALAYVTIRGDDPTVEAIGDGANAATAETQAVAGNGEAPALVRATVDAGSVVGVEVTNPVIGTDQFQSSLTPPEFVSKRTIGGEVRAFLDVAPTTNAQFYDFATFATASGHGNSLGTWADVVPAHWLASSPERPRSFSELGLEEREPVVGVLFAAAEAYCTYASKRLPTEIEWELAAVPGLIDVSGVQNWVAGSEAYEPVPSDANVLRGSFGTEQLPVYFRTIGETPTNLVNAGVRCAADEVTEIPRPSGELLYAREFSGTDEARDWPDLHEPTLPDTVFGYHAPDVFHIEVDNSAMVAVMSGEAHTDGTQVRADVELRLPDPTGGEFRYGLIARASEIGALTFVVHPQISDTGKIELAWCVNRFAGAIVEAGSRSGVHRTTTASCEREGTIEVASFRNTLAITFTNGDAELFIDGTKVDTMFHGLDTDGSFGFLAEVFEGDPLLHVHYDNLVVETA